MEVAGGLRQVCRGILRVTRPDAGTLGDVRHLGHALGDFMSLECRLLHGSGDFPRRLGLPVQCIRSEVLQLANLQYFGGYLTDGIDRPARIGLNGIDTLTNIVRRKGLSPWPVPLPRWQRPQTPCLRRRRAQPRS